MGRREKVTLYRNIDVDESADVAIAAPCKLAFLEATNVKNALLYLKVYNKATAATEADTPVFTIPLAANGGKFYMNFKECEPSFSAGLSIRATTGVADNDTGAPGGNECIVNLGTKANYFDAT